MFFYIACCLQDFEIYGNVQNNHLQDKVKEK